MCRGPVGGTGVYIPPFMLTDEDASDSSSLPATTDRRDCVKQDRAPKLNQPKHFAPHTSFRCPPIGESSYSSSAWQAPGTFTPPLTPRCQTYAQAPAAAYSPNSMSAPTCPGWDMTLAPCQQSGNTVSFSSLGPVPQLYGYQAVSQAMPAAQHSGYVGQVGQQPEQVLGGLIDEDDLDEIDCRLQQLLARKQMLLEARTTAVQSIPMPRTPPQQLVLPQQLVASPGNQPLLGGMCCSAEVLLAAANEAPPPVPAGFCMPSFGSCMASQACLSNKLASTGAAMAACCSLPQGVQQVYCSTMAHDKLAELSEMQRLEAALRDELLYLLPMA